MAFQSQLSGVMETVFKAAMFEITRLVEDSFLEEITRCREQVDTLKRRLKVSESQRKQREAETHMECAKCGERGQKSPSETPRTADTQTETKVKQESEMPKEVVNNQVTEEVKYEVKISPRTSWSPCAQSKILNKGENAQVLPDLDVKRNRSDDELGVPGSSNELNDPKYQLNWEDHFDLKSDFEQNGAVDKPSKPLFENTYDMENIDEFNNSSYEDSNVTSMDNTDDDLIYMGQYEEDVKPPTADEQQPCQIGESKGNSGTWSSSKTNAEFGCLLINEEGHLQDPSNVYSDHSECPPNECSHTGTMPLDNASDILGESNTISDISHMFEMLQHQSIGNGLHTCDLCTATFPDSATLKAHKQTHKEPERGFPYLCNQRKKTGARSCNLKSQGPHLCGHCGKAFPSLFRLQKHKCEQMGVKPYSCAVCGNRFSRLWNLKLHQRIHTQEKPHHCTMCDKSFTRADILKVHQRTHTGERPYCCLVCGLSFKRLDHLKSHQRKHMPDQ